VTGGPAVTALLRWALVKTVWLTAGAVFLAGAWLSSVDRFY
jgi:hypothetical protein